MDRADRERVLYTLEALEKITEPGGFATVSGRFIRELAEIIRERESGILIVSDGARFPNSCHDCFAGFSGCCFIAPPEENGECGEQRPGWCPLKEGIHREKSHIL